MKSLADSTKEEALLSGRQNAHPTDWSSDGKFIVYQQVDADGAGFDIFMLPLSGDHKPVVYLQSNYNESHAQLSPDGKWMAYESDESGQSQIYIQAVPRTNVKIQVSANGGEQPRWRRDGKELYFISPERKLMAVSVKSSGSLEVGVPVSLFEYGRAISAAMGGRFEYQPSADGKKFLMMRPAPKSNSESLSAILNWRPAVEK